MSEVGESSTAVTEQPAAPVKRLVKRKPARKQVRDRSSSLSETSGEADLLSAGRSRSDRCGWMLTARQKAELRDFTVQRRNLSNRLAKSTISVSLSLGCPYTSDDLHVYSPGYNKWAGGDKYDSYNACAFVTLSMGFVELTLDLTQQREESKPSQHRSRLGLHSS